MDDLIKPGRLMIRKQILPTSRVTQKDNRTTFPKVRAQDFQKRPFSTRKTSMQTGGVQIPNCASGILLDNVQILCNILPAEKK